MQMPSKRISDSEKIIYHLKVLTGLESERSSWEPRWKELRDFIVPERGFFSGDIPNNGARTDEKRNETSQTKAARVLAAGMHSGLTSPSRVWFKLSLKDKALARLDSVRMWLEDTQERILGVLSSSNFYPVCHTQYLELGVFGTSVFLIEEDLDYVIRCRCLTIGEYYLKNDAYGRVNTMYRKIKMQPQQIYERFQDKTPQSVKDRCKEAATVWYDVLHAIEPRSLGDSDSRKIGGMYKRFSSTYILLEAERTILEEDGYDEFPACCPRWEVTGSGVYGVGPGVDALANTKMVQDMRGDGFDAVKLENRPPMNVDATLKGGAMGQFGLDSGYANFVDMNTGQPMISPTYQIRANLPALGEWIFDYNTQIKESFYNDVFTLLNTLDKGMTATEVNERVAEKMLQLGPVVERMRSELFQPAIERIYNIMGRMGMLSPPPQEILDADWELEIISMLTQAQKSSNISMLQQFIQFVGGTAQISPEVLDKIDFDEVIDQIATMMNVPVNTIHDKEFVAAKREQRAAEMAQQQRMAQMQMLVAQGADVAEKLSNVNLGEDNAMTAMLNR